MSKGKKAFVVLMSILILVLASCETGEEITAPTTQPEVTTTAPVQAPAPEPTATQPTTPVAEPVPAPEAQEPAPAPSVSEYELRNLYGSVNSLRNDAIEYDLGSVMPDEFNAADSEFAAIQAEYNEVIDAVPFDGVKAYPLVAKLEKAQADWTTIKEQGMPKRTQIEADKASEMQLKAMSADARTIVPERMDAADELMAQADAFVDAGDYEMAIPAYQQAAAAYDVTAEKAKADSLRQKIFEEGYAKYNEDEFKQGEDCLVAEEALWDSGTTQDYQTGADTLREANDHYANVIAVGAEQKSIEARDRALAAKDTALMAKADVNAPDEFAEADAILNEALENHAQGNYESATPWFGDAADAFDNATSITADMQAKNQEVLAQAAAALQASQEKSDAAEIENNVYLDAAQKRLTLAKSQYDDKAYADSTANAYEVINLAGMSDNFVDAELAQREEARQKALADAKAAADPAMADARTRMAWAEANKIKEDYPDVYKTGASSMKAAELAYSNERYDSARSLAEDVSATFSDEFQAQVAADRAAAEEAARQEQLELAKAQARSNADMAITDAKARMNWAVDNGIEADYPDEYSTASTAMDSAELAYSTEDYATAIDQANIVSATLSDEFQAKVAADRAAAAAQAQYQEAEAVSAATEEAPEPEAMVEEAPEPEAMVEEAPEPEAMVEEAPEPEAMVEEAPEPEAMVEEAPESEAMVEEAPESEAMVEEAPVSEAVVEEAPEPEAVVEEAPGPVATDQAAAQKAIADADVQFQLAKSHNAENNFPADYVSAKATLDVAKKAFDSGDYATALAKATKASGMFAAIPEFAPLPATYTVRLIPNRRDCLWRIAEYPFIYNNPLKWKVLYDANKSTFKDPSNPDLIFPGQILDVPSIAGEVRDGAWDPNKTYKPLTK